MVPGEGHLGHTVVGFRHGWRGVVESDAVDLTIDSMHGILTQGGTMLGTSRFHPPEGSGAMEAVLDTVRRERIDVLICIGGDGTLAAADRVHTTAESHDRVMVVEVMGHHAGWIAASAGIAGGAHVILIPEDPFDISEVCAWIVHRHRRGAASSVVVVAEGAVPIPGTFEVDIPNDPDVPIPAGAVSKRIRRPPTATNRLLGSRFGLAAVQAVHDRDFGIVVALRNNDIVRVPFAEAVGRLKLVDEPLREAIRILAS